MGATFQDLATAWSRYAAELEANRQVLVIDDDPEVSEVLVMALEMDGFTCQRAGSGEEATRVFLAGDFAAILVDKNLPDTNGIDLARRLQSFDADCEVVVITGYANLESVRDAIKLRAVDYLTKPLEDVALLPATFARAGRRRRRRLLARRMLADLRREVGLRAGEEDLAGLIALREEVDAFKRVIRGQRRIIYPTAKRPELGACLDFLAKGGFELWGVESSAEALARVAGHNVQVALVTEPFAELGGLAFYEELNDQHGPPEVIFIARGEELDDAIEALSRGASAFFAEPLDEPGAVVAAVRRACDDHHERICHHRLIAGLHRLFSEVASRDARPGVTGEVQHLLADLDLTAAQQAMESLATDSPDAWQNPPRGHKT